MSTSLQEFHGVHAAGERKVQASPPPVLFLIDEIGGIAEGGTERQVLQLVKLASRLDYAPRLAVLRGTQWLTEEQAGCPVYCAGVGSLLRPSSWRSCLDLVRWMRRQRIQLVQTFFIECNMLGPWLARLSGVPVVIGSRRNLNDWMGPVTRQIQRLANRSVDCIVANSQIAADSIQSGERVPHHKLQVAYNGIDLAKFSRLDRLRGQGRRMLGMAEDEILVGNISCFRPVKGIPQYIEAARLVLEQEPRMRFLLVGGGEQYALVAERIRKYGLEDRIHLAGQQTDVLPYLAAMDIGVLSSLAEGFSNSLLEYMASGLPAVATEVGGNREALEGAGILVPPNDPQALAEAILELRSSSLREQMGLAARQRVERFSLARAENRMKEIYAELLQGNGTLPKED